MTISRPLFLPANSLDEALAAKEENSAAAFIAGGTSLVPDRHVHEPAGYISLRRIPALQEIERRTDGLFVGAGCTIATLIRDPLVARASLLVQAGRATATRQVRSRATIGGNIAVALADRSLPPSLLALEASVHVHSREGLRRIPLERYLSAPAKTAAPEILVGVTIPHTGGYHHYSRVAAGNGGGYATVSVALLLDRERRVVRIGLGGAGPIACRAQEAEAFAEVALDWKSGAAPTSLATEVGEIAAQHCNPASDLSASAAYRRHAIRVMVRRALEEGWETVP
ncbi:MAG: FAD binding domain-containing protein [Reyranella sp.]